MSGVLRDKPYFWITWLTPLLAGEDSCEGKVYTKGHFSNVEKYSREELKEIYPDNGRFKDQDWDSAHTAMLNNLRAEYQPKSKTVLKERDWKIVGKESGTTVAGKIDLVTLEPNLVIDAKTGKPKNSHILQVRAYLLAIKLGAVPGITGEFKGLLRYPDHEVEVSYDPAFPNHFYSLVKRLAKLGQSNGLWVPSYNECRFCDLKECSSRVVKEEVFETVMF